MVESSGILIEMLKDDDLMWVLQSQEEFENPCDGLMAKFITVMWPSGWRMWTWTTDKMRQWFGKHSLGI